MAKRIQEYNNLITDEQIIELYWQRNEAAIQETDKKYGKLLYSIAYNILKNDCDCEECQSDTYLKTWNAIPPSRPAVFPAFVCKIMRFVSINRYKEKKVKRNIPSELTVSMDELYDTLKSDKTAEEQYEAEEVGKIISEYVRCLSKKNQYIFVGRFYMLDSVDSIANELGMSASNVYKALNRIKQGLKCYLEKNGVFI